MSAETLDQKKERLWPILEESYKTYFEDGEAREKAELVVTRILKEGKEEVIPYLVACEMTDDGPAFCYIDDNNDPTEGATMLWSEIVDAKKMMDNKKEEQQN